MVTTGFAAASTPDPATTSRSVSASSWVALAIGTVYWVPPVNSMPKLSPLTTITTIATATRMIETAYQMARWPMKSKDLRPP